MYATTAYYFCIYKYKVHGLCFVHKNLTFVMCEFLYCHCKIDTF